MVQIYIYILDKSQNVLARCEQQINGRDLLYRDHALCIIIITMNLAQFVCLTVVRVLAESLVLREKRDWS